MEIAGPPQGVAALGHPLYAGLRAPPRPEVLDLWPDEPQAAIATTQPEAVRAARRGWRGRRVPGVGMVSSRLGRVMVPLRTRPSPAFQRVIGKFNPGATGNTSPRYIRP